MNADAVRDVLPLPWGDVILWLVTMGPFWLTLGWWWRRDRRQAAEWQRHYAVQQQVWEMERQIWDEQLSDEAREAQRQAHERAAEVTREARRRLGLLEEEET
jgi:hypothetical protein